MVDTARWGKSSTLEWKHASNGGCAFVYRLYIESFSWSSPLYRYFSQRSDVVFIVQSRELLAWQPKVKRRTGSKVALLNHTFTLAWEVGFNTGKATSRYMWVYIWAFVLALSMRQTSASMQPVTCMSVSRLFKIYPQPEDVHHCILIL